MFALALFGRVISSEVLVMLWFWLLPVLDDRMQILGGAASSHAEFDRVGAKALAAYAR